MHTLTAPVGPITRTLALLDDALFDAQCSADAQTVNTAAMLEAFERIWRDGRLDDDDAPDLCYLRRHTLLEHRLNEGQFALLDAARDGVAGAGRVIQRLRGAVQEMRRAAGKAALPAPIQAPAQLNGNGRDV